MTSTPRVRDVVIRTLRESPAHTRNAVRIVLGMYALVVVLQIWDVRDSSGAPMIAELASVFLGIGGILLLGLAQLLRNAGMPPGGPPRTLIPRPAPDIDTPAIRQILLAMPIVGFTAGTLFVAGVVVLIARIWLGASAAYLIVVAIHAAGVVASAQVVSTAARRLYRHAEDQAARGARAEAQLTEARLSALQAQMQPHFLFNALNTVASLVRTDAAAAEATVENLSDVLRRTLERSKTPAGTLEEEVVFVQAYLAVETQRLGDRLHVDWAIARDTRTAAVPPLLLQPLVENAIKHGIGPRGAGGHISISAERVQDRLHLVVEDDGEGFAPRAREGTGLGNVRRRLDALHGPAASVTVADVPTGARVVVDLPFIPAGEPA